MRRAALALLALLATAPRAGAQDYAFSVPTVLLETWVETDGTLTLDYTFTFLNEPGAKALDGVDVGMPSTRWSLSRVKAWQDGEPLEVQSSPYVDNAVAANLPRGGLAPGTGATVRVRAEGVGGLLVSDTTAKERVSLRLTPTWFGSQYVRGRSFVRVVIHLPPGISPADLTWHSVEWVGQVQVEATPERPAHPAVIFERTYPFTSEWQVGVSFPELATQGERRPVVAGVRRVTTWDLFQAWAGQPGSRAKGSGTFIVVFAILFLWATRRTGCLVLGVLSVVLFVAFQAVPVLPWLAMPALPLFAWAVLAARRRRKRAYVPAVASVEGGGIKRGLTAPEAACLLEAPPEKILLLVLYGLSRKGFVTLDEPSAKRLMATVTPGFGVTPAEDVRLAAEKGSVLHPYESAFLAMLGGAVPKDVGSLDWREALKGVAKHAATRLTGYDLEQTRGYYRSIVARAWKEAQGIGDVTLRKQAVDRDFDWLVLEGDAWRRMDAWHRAGWRYSNPWLPGPRAAGGGALPTLGGASPPPLPGAPKAGDVAGSIGGRLEGLAGSFATTLGVGSAKGTFAGFDHAAGEAFASAIKNMASSSGGRGGGGGFSCACACAGCACACACAGGGR